jgi:hypothetical protein
LENCFAIHLPARADGEEHVAAVGLALGREALGRRQAATSTTRSASVGGRGEDDGAGTVVPPLLEGLGDLARGVEDGARVRLAVLVVRVRQGLHLLEAIELGPPLLRPRLAAAPVDLLSSFSSTRRVWRAWSRRV